MSQPKTLYDLIEAQTIQTPDAIALVAPNQQPLTYQQLWQQMGAVATTLTMMGFCRGDRIAVVLPNGPVMAASFLAIAAYTTCAPLNPAYQYAEFDFYLRDIQSKALLVPAGSDSPAIAVAQAQNITVLELEIDATTAGCFTLLMHSPRQASPTAELLQVASAEDIALILHTSGTTSRPKIVPLTHANLCTSANTIRRTLELTSADRCLNIMPLFHIHGLIGVLLSSLAAGGSVICTPGLNAEQFFDWVSEFKPTWYSAVPTMHQAILAQSKSYSKSTVNSTLRLIRSSSASLSSTILIALEQAFNVPVIEAYGMTEAAHQIASNRLPPNLRKTGSVGKPTGVEMGIMNEVGELLPLGEVGEVVIRGANVTRGYENNPVANAAAFTQGWFRTGDQGYFDTDGYLFLQGRLKEMINRGGEKIAPLEVDAVLMELPDVSQAVTFAVPHPTLGEDVATAVVLHPDAAICEQAIRDFLFQRLASFKVPSQVVIVEAIPTGPTGKLQRIGLAEQLADHLHAPAVAPRNPVEQAIAAMVAEILNLENPSIYDNFFALGGDSLTGTQVVNRLNAYFSTEVPNTLLFHKPTIAELAEVMLPHSPELYEQGEL